VIDANAQEKKHRYDNDEIVAASEHDLKRRSRRNFFALLAAAALGFGGWEWLNSRGDEDGIPGPYRRALDWNRKVTGDLLFSDRHLAPEFPLSKVRQIRANGNIGLSDELDEAAWRLQLTPLGSGQVTQRLDMGAIRALPKVEQTIEFKCVEGWSTVTNWGGIRLSDFTVKYAPGSEKAAYVGLVTPDQEYYVGLDMPSALHPQTLLAYEKDGKPLTSEHGAPLRLIIPVKYGIKNLKRIGSITYSNTRPGDYWAEEGYDYYAAL
jgi:DMSO/TMAO reductase YedYZ molybdopterin-dependent catalytic subunit